MGRPTKPTVLKILSGTNQPCRIRNDEPMPDSDNIDMPENMSDAAIKQWDNIKPILLECRVLTNIDSVALSILCNAVADMFKLQKDLDKFGIFTKGRYKKIVVSPIFTALNQKQEQVRRMLIEFGMTPSSRARVGTTGSPKKGEFDF